MDINNLLLEIYNYHDEKYLKYEKLLKKIDHWEKDDKYEINYPHVIFYDKNKKKLFSCNFNIIGQYFKENKVFIWSWANYIFNKQLNYLTKDLLNYGLNNDNKFIKLIFTNSRLIINNNINLDHIIFLSFYLSQKEAILKHHNIHNEIEEFWFLWNINLL